MSALVSHPTGNPVLRAVLRGLEKNDCLAEFWTTLGLPASVAKASFLPEQMRRRLALRHFGEVGWERTRLRPLRETTRLMARGAQIHALTRHETGWASVDAVYRDLDRAVARRVNSSSCSASLVYAYEDGAHDTFFAARNTGRTRVYDLPIAHWRTLRRLLQEEAERLPEWACTMEGLRDSAEKHDRKDAELELADHVIVGSSFTRDSVRETAGGIPVHITPYGCPPPAVVDPSERAKGGPIQLLFVGHLAQRKGIADLIAALNLLEINWHLTLAGPRPVVAPRALDTCLDNPRVTYLGTVPHSTLLECMIQAHLLVFPSIVEGFGMVITEALSAGLPVITTPHTAGPDILTEGRDGFVVPIRSPESLADRITRLADDESLRLSMACAARTKAAQMSWSHYEAQIAKLVTGWLR